MLLNEPDAEITADDLKSLALDRLAEIPIEGVEGSPLDADLIYKVILRAAVGRTSVWHVCAQTEDTPKDDTVRDWLRTIDATALEDAANDQLVRDATTILDPDRSRIVCIDFVDNPYHGSHFAHPSELCTMAARDGTMTCHRYCTAFVLDTAKPLTVAFTAVDATDSPIDAVERVLDRVDALPFEIKCLLADRGFYTERVIRRARRTAPLVLPVVTGGKRLRELLETHASYWTEYAMYHGSERELRFPLAVCVSYQNGRRGTHGETVTGYVACDLPGRTPKQVETLYRKRPAIETSYRLYRQARATTTTPDPRIRTLFVAVAFILENLWLVVRWAVVARPRRGGRDLPVGFTFELVREWIRHRLNSDLGWRWSWETNGIGVPPGYGPDAA